MKKLGLAKLNGLREDWNPALSSMTTQELHDLLLSPKSAQRRRAAKHIGKQKVQELASALHGAYLQERNDKRTWETQTEMLKAIGLVAWKEARPDVEPIVRRNEPHDMITSAAASTYVRLTRESEQDAQPVLELLAFGSVSVISGALAVLAVDQMHPSDHDISELLRLCRDIHQHPDRLGHEFGLEDSRKYLAIACANWDRELTTDFLNHCIETAVFPNRFGKPVEDTNLIAVCQNSLKGTFSKAYLP